jgi:hypothetical protein
MSWGNLLSWLDLPRTCCEEAPQRYPALSHSSISLRSRDLYRFMGHRFRKPLANPPGRRGSQSVYTGGTPEAHRRYTRESLVHPVYLRCTQRERRENRAVRSEMNPKSAGLPKVYSVSCPFLPCQTTRSGHMRQRKSEAIWIDIGNLGNRGPGHEPYHQYFPNSRPASMNAL